MLVIDWNYAFQIVGFGIVMVFIILVLLVFLIKAFGMALAPKISIIKTIFKVSHSTNKVEYETAVVRERVSADEITAIAMALHLYFEEEHDEESDIITIKTVERRYSPWSSKIYGLNNLK